MKLISSPVKPSQLIFPSLILIKSCNTSILVHTLSDIMCQSFILYLIDNLPSLSDVHTCVRHWVTNGNLGHNFNDIVLRNQTVTDEFYKPLLKPQNKGKLIR